MRAREELGRQGVLRLRFDGDRKVTVSAETLVDVAAWSLAEPVQRGDIGQPPTRLRAELQGDLPTPATTADLNHVIVVRGAGENSFEALLAEPEWEADPDAEVILTGARPTPNDVTQVLFTSGMELPTGAVNLHLPQRAGVIIGTP